MPRKKRSIEQIKQMVYLPKSLHKRLRVEAFKRDTSRSALVTEAVEKYLLCDQGEKNG